MAAPAPFMPSADLQTPIPGKSPSTIPATTIHHPPSTIHHPPSTIHHPPSTIHHPPSTIHHPPSIIHHPPSIIHHPPSTIHHPSSTIHHPPSTIQRSRLPPCLPLLHRSYSTRVRKSTKRLSFADPVVCDFS